MADNADMVENEAAAPSETALNGADETANEANKVMEAAKDRAVTFAEGLAEAMSASGKGHQRCRWR